MTQHEQITIDSETMAGKSSIKGTRITVELILEKLTYDELWRITPACAVKILWRQLNTEIS